MAGDANNSHKMVIHPRRDLGRRKCLLLLSVGQQWPWQTLSYPGLDTIEIAPYEYNAPPKKNNVAFGRATSVPPIFVLGDPKKQATL